jgi:hypothetical protein
VLQRPGQDFVHDKTIPGEGNGRFDHGFPIQVAETLHRLPESTDGSGDPNDQISDARFLPIDFAFRVEKHRRSRGSRSFFTVIHRLDFPGFRHPNHHESATAEVSGRRVGDGQGEARRYRGVHSVAALLEDLATDTGSDRIDRYDKTVSIRIWWGRDVRPSAGVGSRTGNRQYDTKQPCQGQP